MAGGPSTPSGSGTGARGFQALKTMPRVHPYLGTPSALLVVSTSQGPSVEVG